VSISGVLGWGVGGIEAEAVMLGQPISMLLPEVIGYKLIGQLPPQATATDLVLTLTEQLRQVGVVGKFVEFFGPGLRQLTVADRSTLANMCPEYGATVAFFPVDDATVEYLEQTGRSPEAVRVCVAYAKINGMYGEQIAQDPAFSRVLEFDLSSVVSCVSGPKRPQDRTTLTDLKSEFLAGLTAKVSFKVISTDVRA
jgi:aconitate hydratase